jgi:hypothetical protein
MKTRPTYALRNGTSTLRSGIPRHARAFDRVEVEALMAHIRRLLLLCAAFVANTVAVGLLLRLDPPGMCWPTSVCGCLAMVLIIGSIVLLVFVVIALVKTLVLLRTRP